MMLGYSKNWSTIGLSFRKRYSDFLWLFSILGYILQSDRCLVFRILNYRSSLFMLSIIRVFVIFGILAYSRSDIKYTVQREFYYKAMLSGHYYSTSFEDSYSRKCRRCLYSDYCAVNLTALPTVIHILIGIIPIHVPFVFILPLIEIARTQIL